MRLIVVSFSIILGLIPCSHAQDLTKVTIGGIEPGKTRVEGFSVSEGTKIRVDGTSVRAIVGERNSSLTTCYGWILKRDTRKLVWGSFDLKMPKSMFSNGGVWPFHDEIYLPAGDYELYYSCTEIPSLNDQWKRKLAKLFPNIAKPLSFAELDDLHIKVSGPDHILQKQSVKADQMLDNVAVSITGVKNSQSLAKSFEVTKPTRFRVYALGEGIRRDGGIYDYGWIMNVDDHKRAWTMTVRNSVCAGGNEKNILTTDYIKLAPGTYELHYVTDDSHSTEAWNADPPHDPLLYGISLLVEKESDLDHIRQVKSVERPAPFLEMVRIGNDRTVSRGFKLKKDMTIRVVCLGEQDRDGNMADYGWITDLGTHEKVWNMEPRQTQHAGGAYKNRMADEILRLKKGEYVVHYRTDDSHAYDRWNSSPPFDGDSWGISLWAKHKDDYASVGLFSVKEIQEKILLEKIVGVTDYQYIEKIVTIEEPLMVKVQAIGEGTKSDGLVDYGWIENDETGNAVWVMKMEKTKHAGGAEKNRIQVDTLQLEPGRYKICYETDGSHSYNNWNASPPHNQKQYGILVFRKKAH